MSAMNFEKICQHISHFSVHLAICYPQYYFVDAVLYAIVLSHLN